MSTVRQEYFLKVFKSVFFNLIIRRGQEGQACQQQLGCSEASAGGGGQPVVRMSEPPSPTHPPTHGKHFAKNQTLHKTKIVKIARGQNVRRLPPPQPPRQTHMWNNTQQAKLQKGESFTNPKHEGSSFISSIFVYRQNSVFVNILLFSSRRLHHSHETSDAKVIFRVANPAGL